MGSVLLTWTHTKHLSTHSQLVILRPAPFQAELRTEL